MNRSLLFCAALGLFNPGSGSAMASAQAEAATWVIDPAVPGENLPAAGRSLFDELFDQRFAAQRQDQAQVDLDLPFPFAALLARIDAQLQRDPSSALPAAKRVLIPVGRSLQRSAAAPDYFAFPRVVVAADSPPASPTSLLLKDRLYIGYQEKSAVIEVISYNESAGRFEFQVVKNYRAGGRPQVAYANRTLCFACHQNGGPIFSRALWDETNANPKIAARLVASGKDFYGIPAERGVDVPYAIDLAIQRANGLALTQRLWQEGCGDADREARRCRAGLFVAALRQVLGDGRKGSPSADFGANVAAPLRAAAARRWPGGLASGAADIANRDPLSGLADGPAAPTWQAHLAPRFDPLLARPARDVWRADGADAIDQAVSGLAQFVSASDRQVLETALAAAPAARLRQSLPCRFETQGSRWSARCQLAVGDGKQQLSATLERRKGQRSSARIERLTLPQSGTINAIELAASRPVAGEHVALRPGAPTRGADGNRLLRIAFRVAPDDAATGQVLVDFRQEFGQVERAIAALLDGADGAALFGDRPFPRRELLAALFAQLGVPRPKPCCQAAKRLPPARLDFPATTDGSAANPASPENSPEDPAIRGFYPYCATCHQSAEPFPPNFLSGDRDHVVTRLRQCAPRLYVRLAMADLAPEQRAKTPMPPESLLPAFASDRAGWRESPARAALLAQVRHWLRAESGQAPQLENLLAGGYEALRPCLPPP